MRKYKTVGVEEAKKIVAQWIVDEHGTETGPSHATRKSGTILLSCAHCSESLLLTIRGN